MVIEHPITQPFADEVSVVGSNTGADRFLFPLPRVGVDQQREERVLRVSLRSVKLNCTGGMRLSCERVDVGVRHCRRTAPHPSPHLASPYLPSPPPPRAYLNCFCGSHRILIGCSLGCLLCLLLSWTYHDVTIRWPHLQQCFCRLLLAHTGWGEQNSPLYACCLWPDMTRL